MIVETIQKAPFGVLFVLEVFFKSTFPLPLNFLLTIHKLFAIIHTTLLLSESDHFGLRRDEFGHNNEKGEIEWDS